MWISRGGTPVGYDGNMLARVHLRILWGSYSLIFSFLCSVLDIIVFLSIVFGYCIVCASIWRFWLFLLEDGVLKYLYKEASHCATSVLSKISPVKHHLNKPIYKTRWHRERVLCRFMLHCRTSKWLLSVVSGWKDWVIVSNEWFSMNYKVNGSNWNTNLFDRVWDQVRRGTVRGGVLKFIISKSQQSYPPLGPTRCTALIQSTSSGNHVNILHFLGELTKIVKNDLINVCVKWL